MRVASGGLALAALLVAAPAVAAPNVVVTIKPLHSLVAGVMEGVGEPVLLIEGAQSPHSFALRPSDAGRLESADMVFWIGPEMETFLERSLATLAGDAEHHAMMEIDGLILQPLREGGLFEGHDHGHDDHDHDHDHDGHAHDHDDHHHHGDVDAQIWLDPNNARLMVAAIAEALIGADPDNREAYDANGMALVQRLAALDREIAERLEGLGEAQWFVFHDAYQSFEAHYGLSATGSFTVNPEVAPGAARLSEIRDTIRQAEASCIFAEPQFSSAVVETVAQETGARIGVLDPLGAELAAGPEQYFGMMRALADSLVECLGE